MDSLQDTLIERRSKALIDYRRSKTLGNRNGELIYWGMVVAYDVALREIARVTKADR